MIRYRLGYKIDGQWKYRIVTRSVLLDILPALTVVADSISINRVKPKFTLLSDNAE